MLGFRKLACSFCGKDATQVSKLVAGPKVYICDACVAEASRIMSMSTGGAAPRSEARSFWTSVAERIARLVGRVQLRAA